MDALSSKSIARWRMTRQQTREARAQVRIGGDLEAAEQLLRHSIACGHQNLIVRRFLLSLALGLRDPQRYELFFLAALPNLRPGALHSASQDAQTLLDRLKARGAVKPKSM